MPTYAGTDLGIVSESNTEANPKERQANAYPGVDGLQLIDHGTRGATSYARGHLVASSGAALASLLATFRGYQLAGGKAQLVDKWGTAWDGVILTRFRPTGPAYPCVGGMCQAYEAEFLHPDI